MRRCLRRLGSTNRYTDGSGRALDSSDLPTSLDLQPISNRAYPVQGEHWLPVIAGKPSPQKGNVIISGAGVVGLSIGTQFALRGWHTTIVERASRRLDSQRRPASEMMLHDARASAITVDPLRPFDALEYALVNRRAANALEAAGVRVGAFRDYGVPVSGVMDHPGAYNSWLTKGLVEHHSFATKVLSMDLWLLRQHMTRHAEGLTQGSLEVFYDHTVEAVYPLKQQAVVKPWEGSVAQKEWRQANSIVAGTTGEAEDMVLKLKQEQVRRKKNTSLSISPLKWAKQFVKDAVDYDLLIGAEGINSRMRDAFDIEGFAADIDFGVKWFLLESSSLSAAHIHRWLHRRQHAPVKSAESYHIQSPYQVPMCVAFPRVENAESSQSPSPSSSPRHFFSVMAYMPMHELMALSDEEMLHRFLRDVVQVDPQAKLKSFTRITQPSPTIYCENLHNTVGLPSAVMVGDAAHYCHPFWMQGLAMGLEDGLNLLNQVDSFSRHFFEAVKQYSDERGVSGDAMRELTDNCLYYQRKKHRNPLIRFRNSYQQWMNLVTPKRINDMYEGSVNHVYSRSIEDMLNGRGYTSYDYAEKQQAKHRSFYHIGRLYT